MGKSPRNRRLGAEQRRVLELLAGSRHGITEELLMYGHGFSWRMVAGLLRARLATVQRRMIVAGDMLAEIGKVMITAAGRRAIEAG